MFCFEQVHQHEIFPIAVNMDASPVNVFAKAHNTYANKVCTICFYQCYCFYLIQSNSNRIVMLIGYRISKTKYTK